MGSITDAEEVYRAVHPKNRARILWSLAAMLGTIVCTTATVSWKMSRYVAKMEIENEKLRGEIRQLAKNVEKVELAMDPIHKEAQDARILADNAVFLARLAHKGGPP